MAISVSSGFNAWIASVLFMVCSVGVKGSHRIFPHAKSIHIINKTHYEEFRETAVSPILRTAFHFQPPQNWMNDPNGPMYYNGLYHLFYQYNPKGAVWGNIIWAHSVSKDLINWVALKPAIYPTKPYDQHGCWSGSATVIHGKGPVILYTALDAHNRQAQAYAIPQNLSDPLLQNWVKPADNPIAIPDPSINETMFRDPTTAWRSEANGHWRILVGGLRNGRPNRGIAFLYRSRDFVRWRASKHPLFSETMTGMWECPDFFPVMENGSTMGLETSAMSATGSGVKHVLKVSLDRTKYDVYSIGEYDPSRDRYVPDGDSSNGWNGMRYDYGNFYASKTFYDARRSRRVLWGWSNESDTADNDEAKGWAGIQTIPRSIWLDGNKKQLIQWPIKEVEKLRSGRVDLRNREVRAGETIRITGVTASQADVEVTFWIGDVGKAEMFEERWVNAGDVCDEKGSEVGGGIGPFGLLTLASPDLQEFTPVFFRIFKAGINHRVLMCSDARSSSLMDDSEVYKPPYGGFIDTHLTDGKLSLRTLIDGCVVESFGDGGKACITSRVYPTRALGNMAGLYVFNNGTGAVTVKTLHAWNITRPPLMNHNNIPQDFPH